MIPTELYRSVSNLNRITTMSTKTLLIALAASAALLSPAVATQAAASTACSQLERSAGLRGDECGRLPLAEVARLHTGRASG
jgi:hypothetical protein